MQTGHTAAMRSPSRVFGYTAAPPLPRGPAKRSWEGKMTIRFVVLGFFGFMAGALTM